MVEGCIDAGNLFLRNISYHSSLLISQELVKAFQSLKDIGWRVMKCYISDKSVFCVAGLKCIKYNQIRYDQELD
jgi:hypothetical protein